MLPFTPPALVQSDPDLPQALELAQPGMERIAPSVWVGRAAPGVWVTSFTHHLEDGTAYPANGLLLEVEGGAVLVDPGWDAKQAEALLAWSRGTLKRPVLKAVVTHSHADRSGGVATLQAAKIPVIGLGLTRELLLKQGKAAPEAVPGLEAGLVKDPLGFELFYPGPGHTRDNIVVYVPSAKLLGGGCFLKSTTAPDLGYLEDASVESWPRSLRRLREAFPDARIQVPGHGGLQGSAIARTQSLLAQSVALSGAGLKAQQLDAAGLAKLPRVKVKASVHGQESTYEGVPLAELLKAAGAPQGEQLRGEAARLALVATGADGYRAVFSLAELDPAVAERGVILADRKDGQPLPASEGPFRLVAPQEQRPVRWVRQLSALTLKAVD